MYFIYIYIYIFEKSSSKTHYFSIGSSLAFKCWCWCLSLWKPFVVVFHHLYWYCCMLLMLWCWYFAHAALSYSRPQLYLLLFHRNAVTVLECGCCCCSWVCLWEAWPPPSSSWTRWASAAAGTTTIPTPATTGMYRIFHNKCFFDRNATKPSCAASFQYESTLDSCWLGTFWRHKAPSAGAREVATYLLSPCI